MSSAKDRSTESIVKGLRRYYGRHIENGSLNDEVHVIMARLEDAGAEIDKLRGALAFIACYRIEDPNTPAAVLLDGLRKIAATGLGATLEQIESDRALAAESVEKAFALDAFRNSNTCE